MKPRAITTRACVALLAMAALTASIRAAEITNTQDLIFGTLVAGPSGGTLTVPPIGSRQCSAGITCLPSAAASPARYQVSGTPSAMFGISLPDYVLLTNENGVTMRVDTFTDSLGGSGLLNSLGQASFTVGATLHLDSAQARGAYAGTFLVTVSYQ